jgi:PAS domain S-box-containing protein
MKHENEWLDLRERAESMATSKSVDGHDPDPAELRRILHELQVHQIELEIQNEELRSSRNALETARDEYARLYNDSPVGYLSLDYAGLIVKANQRFSDWLGEDRKLVGQAFADLLEPPDRQTFISRFNALFKHPDGKTLDVRLRRPDLMRTVRLVMQRGGGKDQLLVAAADVSDEVNTRAALRDAEHLWSETFHAMNDAIWILDLDGRVLKFNNASERLLGKPGDQIAGCLCYELLHGTGAHIDGCPYLRMISSGKREAMVLRDGQRWLEVTVDPLHSGEGRLLGSVHITKDITPRKQSEDRISALLDEKQLLLKETHHRIKNNMSVISSLLALQAMRLDNAAVSEALDEARQRILGMMVLYDKLYRSRDFRYVSVAEYLTELVNEIKAQNNKPGVCIAAAFEDFQLASTVLFPLGIIMNELISNALKYAFPGDRPGTIKVSIQREPETDIVIFAVVDDGIGMKMAVDDPALEGFGLVLVRGLASQLHAETSFETTDGSRFKLRFKSSVSDLDTQDTRPVGVAQVSENG